MKKLFPVSFVTSIFFTLVVPSVASAEVFISEVAWMGTSASANDEWIELANDGTAPVSLDGWKLATGDGGVSTSLTGSLPANGYYLLERTSDDTVAGITADAIYTGSLSNTGEVLVLSDKSGAVVDRVDASTGWPAGDNTTKDTMQKFSGSWVSAISTPKAANSSVHSVVADTGTNTQSSSAGNSSSSSSSSGEKTSSGSARISAGKDRLVALGTPIIFEGTFSGEQSGTDFTWSFGDGTKAQGQSVRHVYAFPGDYIAVFSARSAGAVSSSRVQVKVFDPLFDMRLGTARGKSFLEITNKASYEVNMGNFILRKDRHEFIFPDDTVLGVKGALKLSRETLGFSLDDQDPIELLAPDHSTLALFTPAISTSSLPILAARLADAGKKVDEVKSKVSLLASTVAVAPKSIAQVYNAPPAPKQTEEISPAASSTVTVTEPEGFFKRILHFFFRG